MAHVVKKEDYKAKRNEILDVALRLIYSKGYEQMTIQDILDDLQISKGALYHYFDSKAAVLEGFIERIQEETAKPLLAIINDPQLRALGKLQSYFNAFDRLRIAHKSSIGELLSVWYTDDNAIVRQKVDEAILKQHAPLLAEIVRQGIQEGVFALAHPDQAGEVIQSLVQSMSHRHARLLLSLQQGQDDAHDIEGIVMTHTAYMEAIERLLGAPANSLHRTDTAAVQVWVAMLRGNRRS